MCVLLQITVELKNDLSITGTLHSVDQYLNIKLNNIRVVNQQKYPHMLSVRNCFIRGSVVRYVQVRRWHGGCTALERLPGRVLELKMSCWLSWLGPSVGLTGSGAGRLMQPTGYGCRDRRRVDPYEHSTLGTAALLGSSSPPL